MDRQEALPTCPECGAVVSGAAAGCQALYDELQGLIDSDDSFGQYRRVVHDTYCIQHPTRYIRHRTKALAAHLGGLCWVVEYSGHLIGYQALQRWLERVPWHTMPMPRLPGVRSDVTVVSVHRVLQETAEPKQFSRAVERWACSTWEAYAELHPLIRGWIEEALTTRRSHHR
ncbi:MAG: DUF5946 family protein [Thermomicrobiales bacterium]